MSKNNDRFNRRPNDDELLFIPLGGCGEIGMNLNLYGTAGKWLMLDLGISFSNGTLPGIDVIMPDPQFIEQHSGDLLAVVLTHGHEDHIGAVPYLWSMLRCPIYATPFTANLVQRKLEEAGLGQQAKITILPMNGIVNIGPFSCELVTLTHSIPEPNAVIIKTKFGTVVHTGDWKIDPMPLVGSVTDIARLKQIGDEGVLAVVCDSTNVFNPGHSGSESEVRTNLTKLIAKLPNKVAVTGFASNVARLSSIAFAAAAAGRQVALVGRSMHRIYEAAKATGYLQDFPEIISEKSAGRLADNKILYLCTGSQGEIRGAMSRISSGDHRFVSLKAGDHALFSSKIIPGNELSIATLHNRFVASGVNVITEKNAPIHVSGHPNRDELAIMYSWLRPQISLPVHGEIRHLNEHAIFAKSLNIKHTPVINNGMVLRLAPGDPCFIGNVKSGRLGVDGQLLVPVSSSTINERRKMSNNGHAVITILLNNKNRLINDPQILLTGIHDDSDDLELRISKAVALEISKTKAKNDELEEKIKKTTMKFLNDMGDKKPHIDVQIIILP